MEKWTKSHGMFLYRNICHLYFHIFSCVCDMGLIKCALLFEQIFGQYEVKVIHTGITKK